MSVDVLFNMVGCEHFVYVLVTSMLRLYFEYIILHEILLELIMPLFVRS
jgi:hypothetical protein